MHKAKGIFLRKNKEIPNLEKGKERYFMAVHKQSLILDVEDKPALGTGLFLSLQHVFAMFGATILVPILLGLPVSVALLASGVGTIIYQIATKAKVPVYLGSSFAYIAAMQIAIEQMGGDISAAQTGIVLVGLTYILIAGLVKVIGTSWIDRLLPPIVIGPMIMVIGLGLASNAVQNAGFVEDSDWRNIVVAIATFLITAFINTKATGFFKIIPFLTGIIAGYLIAVVLGIVDFNPVLEAKWLALPEIYLPFENSTFNSYQFLHFGPETWDNFTDCFSNNR